MRLREAVEAVHHRARKHEEIQISRVPHRERECLVYSEFFRRIDDWLKPLVAESKLQTHHVDVKFTDTALGDISAHALSISPCPAIGIEVLVAPTGQSCANIKHEIKMRRADGLTRAEAYFIYKLVSEGEDGRWFIARRSTNAGRPKVLSQETFEEAICALFLA